MTLPLEDPEQAKGIQELKRQMDAWSWAGEVRVYVAALRQAATEQIGREPDGRLARR